MSVVDRTGYRAAHLAITGVLVLAGLWLAASPLVVGYTRLQLASWHNALAGLALVGLALRLRSAAARRVAPLVGLAAWLLVAPWLLGYGSMLIRNSEPGQATWNGAFMAAVVLAAAGVHTFLVRRRPAEPERT
jgi:hypothetical protein